MSRKYIFKNKKLKTYDELSEKKRRQIRAMMISGGPIDLYSNLFNVWIRMIDGDEVNVDYIVRLPRTKVDPTADWEFIATDYNHIATDKDGTVWTYAQKPVRGKRAWEPQGLGKFRRLVRDACGYKSRGCHWKNSLISRPGVKK